MFLFSHLTYLLQVLYLEKLSIPKYHEFSLKLLFSKCYNTRTLNAKPFTILFHLLIVQLTVYKRSITRFIADDKVVYLRMRREMRLASDNS